MNYFTNIRLQGNTLASYHLRSSIFHALSHVSTSFSGELLDVGCGNMPYRSLCEAQPTISKYVGLDLESRPTDDACTQPDITWDGVTMPFSSALFDVAIATEVLEHCYDPKILLRETHRVLKPDGQFFFTVPFLWNLHEIPNDYYRYTPFALKRLLEECGYERIHIEAMGGWHASLAQMMGLWVSRSPLPRVGKAILKVLFRPLIAYLLQADRKKKWEFSTPLMVTGLWGTARKAQDN